MNQSTPDTPINQEEFPLVSVALPCYNQEEFIASAIESVLEQDYPNIEIILSDDASQDNSKEIIQEYQKRFPKILKPHFHTENQGITPNVLSMVPRFNGKYVAWFSGDDLFMPGKISKQVAMLESMPNAALCYHDIDVFDSKTNNTLYHYNDPNKGQAPYSGMVAKDLILRRCFIGGTSVMIRRDAMPKNSHDPRTPTMSDWLLWIKIADTNEVVFINEVLARYRRHDNNITRTPNHAEEEALYQIIIDEMPQHRRTCRAALARLYCVYTFKYLIGRDFKKSAECARKSSKYLFRSPRLFWQTLLGFGSAANRYIRGGISK